MPLQATSGAASYDAFGGGVAAVPQYIEDVFSTYLYTGNGSTQTINNGIDLAGEGGLVWLKSRTGAYNNYLIPTPNGSGWGYSNTTDAFVGVGGSTFTFNNNGWTTTATGVGVNALGENYASWTFRKQPKFFDVVTWTGNDATSRTLSHSINGTVGCVMVKKTSSAGNWIVWHRTFPTAGDYIILNSTAAKQNDVDNGISTTNTTFTVGFGLNVSGENYVAYLFAHDAGGFGLTGTDNVISCGSYTGNGSATGPVIDLGYEPQFLIIKRASNAADWVMHDNMRGISETSYAQLRPNLSDAEYTGTPAQLSLTSTGFQIRTSGTNYNASGNTYIYIAIRRGPMKVPTSGTSVFVPAIGNNSTSAGGEIFTTNFPVDFFMRKVRATTDFAPFAYSRLTAGKYLVTGTTAAEATDTSTWFDTNTGIDYQYASNFSGQIGWLFQRAPSFFDEVCYTGDGTADSRTFTHNLGVTPQLVMVKRRSSTSDWVVTFNTSHAVLLNSTNADIGYNDATGNYANGILVGTNATTLTQYSGASGNSACNASGSTYVAYLFATCAGVSKVFSYTGNGSSQTINCGFTAGARWILIKRTDSTGDWYVWDSARGIVSGNDPHLSLNTTAAEVTTDDTIDTDSTGFVVNQVSATNVNVSSATYIGIAIA